MGLNENEMLKKLMDTWLNVCRKYVPKSPNKTKNPKEYLWYAENS